jgi:hypothetical protein
MDPGSAAHHAASHSASKTRVNALMALRSIPGTQTLLCGAGGSLRFPRMVLQVLCGPSGRQVTPFVEIAIVFRLAPRRLCG